MPRPKDPSLAGKSERIDTRVSPATREALEKAAAEAGWSLSREIEDRLATSLTRDGADGIGASAATETLLAALRLVVEGAEELTGERWQEDGFTRDAVADALRLLILQLGPAAPAGALPPPKFPTFLPDDAGEGMEILKRETAERLIQEGVGQYLVKMTLHRISSPLPSGDLGAQLERIYSPERTLTKRISSLLRYPPKEG
jgi:hypothetical protein